MPTIFTRGAASARGFGLFGGGPAGPALWSWGDNSVRQLGLGNVTLYSSPKQVGALTDWSALSAGFNFSLATKTNGTMWAWGRNALGQLGLGNITTYTSPKQIGALTTWATVSAGYSHATAVKTDGTLWAWGTNVSGQLGLGNTTAYSSPKQVGALTTWSTISAGRNFSVAVKTDGTMWSWGANTYGCLGLSPLTGGYSSPVQIGAITIWSTVSAGRGANNQSSSCVATRTNGTLWTWGSNDRGQLGIGNTTNQSAPIQVGALTTWSKARSGGNFSASVKTDGTLWMWGYNAQGQLGIGNLTSYSSPKQVGALTTWSTISPSGNVFSLATKTNGTLWSWGYGGFGCLGLGNTYNYSSPKQVGALTTWNVASAGGSTGTAFSLATKT